MNDFKKFKEYKGNNISYNILYEDGDDIVLKLVLSYPNIDIWGDNDRDKLNNIFYKKIYLHRDEWLKRNDYQSVDQVKKDFDDAIVEFGNVDDFINYTSTVNQYLMEQAGTAFNGLDSRQI